MRTLKKNPSAQERLIVALDIDDPKKAIDLVDAVKEHVSWFKVRQHHIVQNGDKGSLLTHLKENDLSILADLQSTSTLDQLAQLVQIACDWECDALSVKADAHHMYTAVSRVAETTMGIGVFSPILLTQMGVGDAGFATASALTEFVVKQSRRAAEHRLQGVITSCQELPEIPNKLQRELVFITPGIRDEILGLKVEHDNQKRTCTLLEAVKNGADYLLIGRPMLYAQEPGLLALKCFEKLREIESTNGLAI